MYTTPIADFSKDWIIPQWPVPETVASVCTTRNGGASEGVWGSFNLGSHVGDDVKHVAQNRTVLAGFTQSVPVYLNQVHGIELLEINPNTPDAQIADGALTCHAGVACTVMVADCLPVLFYSPRLNAVAAVHCGWRSLAGHEGKGILEATVKKLNSPEGPVNYGNIASNVIAWLGPCIGPKAFEVGDDVHQAFLRGHPQAQTHFRPLGNGKWLADLAALARHRLLKLGVTAIYGNDSSPYWCTYSNPSRFFSYRRDGVTGRLAAAIWLRR